MSPIFFDKKDLQDKSVTDIIAYCEDLKMIEVTKLNGVKVLVNPTLFEVVEETPDTVITLTTGKKIIVKESRQEIKNLVILYRKGIFAE